MGEKILVVDNLHTYISGYHILQGVSFEVERGTVTAILGKNGVGKTTTLKTIAGIYKPAKGRVVFKGEDVTGLPPHRVTLKGVSYVPAEKNIFATLTVEENLRLAYNGPKDRLLERLEVVYSLFPELKKLSRMMAGNLSGGQQRMLAIACGMVREHELLILDEPSEGLSPIYVKSFLRRLKEFKDEHGKTVLLVEQNFALAREIVDYVYLMDKGVVVTGFPASALEENRDVVRRILGVSL
ncbi:ABC transporter ATP-binding protein [Infirmifilum sp. NZ]|uniref:ABC transporter ATP-binding protein n=1 Tax=Infirmifilum sp. NZ TaxID=2926850 RepID=UPI0027A69AA8|nr:ABC transporter ATP-binding protein [Infirmifilum sp. NZ]UNQ73488.1 ABC transporter ATP-binding protein [Infirmifilum sp. NZ]